MKLQMTLVAKLAAIVVHADEMLSSDGHTLDRVALESVVLDAEVQQWVASLGPIAPVKRKAR